MTVVRERRGAVESAQSRPTVARPRTELELTDPRPVLAPSAFWRHVAHLAIVGIFLIMFGAVLDLARNILLPIVSAAVIGMMFDPLARVAARWRIPGWLFAGVVVGVLLVILQVVTIMVAVPIIDWIGRAPELAESLRTKLQPFERIFAAFQELQAALNKGGGDSGVTIDIAALAQPLLGFLTPAIGELLIFFATLFFFLLDRSQLRKNIILVFNRPDDRLRAIRIINDIEHNLTLYIGTVTVINLAIGVITAGGAWLVGLGNPVLLGAIAFLCNYIPYIGPAFVVLILFAVGFVSFPSIAHAAVAPLLFVGLTTIEGHFVTPNIIGRRLTLKPLAVFLSLAFWTWLWGPVGAFLSVPFLIFGLVIVNHLVIEDETAIPG
jgi:predicted PurR-regulated permease PerM